MPNRSIVVGLALWMGWASYAFAGGQRPLFTEPGPPHRDLIDVQKAIPSVIVDLKYATSDNFMKKRLYKDTHAYLRRETVEVLKHVAKALELQGYRLVILDAYRPPSVQKEMWDRFPKPGFVAPPVEKYIRHGRGTAVDVTLADTSGKRMVMPSKFDELSAKADLDFSDVSPEAARHGRILLNAFQSSGFTALRKEWWHYDLGGWERYPVIQIQETTGKASNKRSRR